MKGKYAARSANQRAAAEAESSETVYRRRILKLTEERDTARAERDKALLDWKKDIRILRAQLSEGTSPRVEALSQELNRVREERDRLRRRIRDVMERNGEEFERLMEHMLKEHGMSRADAMDAAAELCSGREFFIMDAAEKRVGQVGGIEAARALRKSRGGK